MPSVEQIEAADKATGGKIPLVLLIQALVAAMEPSSRKGEERTLNCPCCGQHIDNMTATPPAPKVTDVEFRLLDAGETIQSDDEVVGDNGKSWVPVGRWAVGTPYSHIFKSVRRPLTAAQEAGKQK